VQNHALRSANAEKGYTALERAKREKNEVEINLADVFQILLSKWIYILIAGLVVALGVGAVTHFLIKKKYTAYTSMYIYTNAEQEQRGTISSSELAAANDLIKTYQSIVKSNRVLEPVAENFIKDLTPEKAERYAKYNVNADWIAKATTVSVPTGTKLIRIDVKTVDPELSADIANAFAKYAPAQIIDITKAGGVEPVDYAKVPTTHSSPSLSRNVIIGFAAGVVLAAAYFLLRAFLDTTIYTSEEVAKVTDCPVIGTIPMIVVGSEEKAQWEVSLREEIINE
jgi:capsular polysaccharide biosynthesis protein